MTALLLRLRNFRIELARPQQRGITAALRFQAHVQRLVK